MKKLASITFLLFSIATFSFGQMGDVHKSDGISAESQEQYEEAAKAFEAAIKAFQEQNIVDTTCIYHAGLNYSKIEQYDKAIPYLKDAIQMNYNVGRASRLLADAYYKQKDIERAEATLIEGKESIPEEGFEFDKKLAYLYFNTGQFEKSAEYFQKVNEADPGKKSYMYLYAFSLERLKKYDQAIELFETIHQQNPSYKKATKMLGITLFEQADALNAAAVENYESNKKANIGDYVKIKRKLENIDTIYEKARVILEEAINDYPNDKQVANSLYQIYKKQSKEDKAAQMKSKL
jgi:tetratricopeptide (TPR) repeat protein